MKRRFDFVRRNGLLALGAGVLASTFALAYLPGSAEWLGPRDAEARAAMGPVQRALGPLASVAASIEWVRFRAVLRAGDTARAYAIADSALELDPLGQGGWLDYAQHLIFERGSFLENETPEGRRRWIQAGLELLARGETLCSTPGELAFTAGLIRSGYLAGIPDGDLGWPGGPDALLAQGRADLERAVASRRKGAAEVLEALDASRR